MRGTGEGDRWGGQVRGQVRGTGKVVEQWRTGGRLLLRCYESL